MFLALSPRMFEQRTGYELGLEELARFAAKTGYAGIEARRRQVNESSAPVEIARFRDTLRGHNLRCAAVTAAGLEKAPAVDDATRVLAVGLALECRLVRVQLVRAQEIPLAQRLADRAARRGMRLMSQLHVGSLFANVDMALDTLGRIGRDNFGVAFEPNNLRFEGLDHGDNAVKALGKKIFACFLEAHKPVAEGTAGAIAIAGRAWMPALPGEPGAPDFGAVFRGLKAVGFDGPVVVTAARHPETDSRGLARTWYDYARRTMAEAGLG